MSARRRTTRLAIVALILALLDAAILVMPAAQPEIIGAAPDATATYLVIETSDHPMSDPRAYPTAVPTDQELARRALPVAVALSCRLQAFDIELDPAYFQVVIARNSDVDSVVRSCIARAAGSDVRWRIDENPHSSYRLFTE